MKKVYTDAEIKARIKGITVIADTREQSNAHILSYLDKKTVPVISRKLDSGDYSYILDGVSAEDELVIERKGSLDELAGNLTADRDRFEREMVRLKAAGTKAFLMVEDATYADIYEHNYVSKLKPASFIASLLEWQIRYNLTISFVPKRLSGEYLYGTLYYHALEKLKRGLV